MVCKNGAHPEGKRKFSDESASFHLHGCMPDNHSGGPLFPALLQVSRESLASRTLQGLENQGHVAKPGWAALSQRRRDDKKNKICGLGGGGAGIGGREKSRPRRCFFRGKRHYNKILKVQI